MWLLGACHLKRLMSIGSKQNVAIWALERSLHECANALFVVYYDYGEDFFSSSDIGAPERIRGRGSAPDCLIRTWISEGNGEEVKECHSLIPESECCSTFPT